MSKKKAPICPKCGEPATKADTHYGPKYLHCGLWAWGPHPLADAATHRARQLAHAAFDPIWQTGLTSRNNAYKMLAQGLGIEGRECHMKLMLEPTARRVPAVAAAIRATIAPGLPEAGLGIGAADC